MTLIPTSFSQNSPPEFKGQRVNNGVVGGPHYIPYFLNTLAGSGNTSSATPVDYPGTIEKVIFKQQTDTAIMVSGSVGAFKGTNAGNVFFYLRFNGAGTDYLIARFFFNDLNTHRAVPFSIPIASGLLSNVAAGVPNYTARLRWSTDNINTNSDANDVIHIRFQEGLFK